MAEMGPARAATAGHAARLAVEFWLDAGGPAGFPRDPEPLIALHLPVTILPLPSLSAAGVAAWARAHDFPAVEEGPDRPLRGCLLAGGGHAFLLVDAADPPAERRLTVAHELGHFLIEVWSPRGRVARGAGVEALAVLDGVRSPTLNERLDAALAGVTLAPYVHLMERAEDGSVSCARVAAAECAADRFALELLAPRAVLRAGVEALGGLPLQQRWALVADRLMRDFALPPIVAGGYAWDLVQELTGGESVREWLGLA